MVPEQGLTRDRDHKKGQRCSFDLLIQVCLIFSSLLMIGSVIFSAYTVRLELNSMHKTQYKLDKKLEKLEQQVKQLNLLVENELAKRKWSLTNGQQMKQRGSRRNKGVQTQSQNCTKKLLQPKPRSYGIFYPKQHSFQVVGQTVGRTLPVMWEACNNPGTGCQPPERTDDITFESKTSFRIPTPGIYHFTCQLILREKSGITFKSHRTKKVIMQIVQSEGSDSKVLLSRVQSTNQPVIHLSGLGKIPNNSIVSVNILPVDNSKVSRIKLIAIDRSVPGGSFFSLFFVETGNWNGTNQN